MGRDSAKGYRIWNCYVGKFITFWESEEIKTKANTNCIGLYQFSHSVMSDSVTPWTAARQASLSITNSWSLLKLMSTVLVMLSNHLNVCHPLLLLPSIFPSIRVFSNESALCIRWPKDWSFSFSISPSNEYSVLVSFRMDWLDLLAVQGTLKSLLQHHSSKASVLWCSAFFTVQLSHPYMSTGITGWQISSKIITIPSLIPECVAYACVLQN